MNANKVIQQKMTAKSGNIVLLRTCLRFILLL